MGGDGDRYWAARRNSRNTSAGPALKISAAKDLSAPDVAPGFENLPAAGIQLRLSRPTVDEQTPDIQHARRRGQSTALRPLCDGIFYRRSADCPWRKTVRESGSV